MSYVQSIFFAISLICSVLLLTSCGGGGSSGDESEDLVSSDITSRTLYTNPGDTALYQLVTDSGEQTTWYGLRDGDGTTSTLDAIEYVDENGQQYLIELGIEGWPERVTDETGLIVDFDYGFEPIASRRSSDFLQGRPVSAEISSISASVTIPGSNNLQQMRTQLSIGSPIVVQRDPVLEAERNGEPVGNLDVFVSECGDPSNNAGLVAVDFRGLTAPLTLRYPARKTSRLGHYVTSVPQRSSSAGLTTDQYCNSFADKLSVLCATYSPAHSSVVVTEQLSNPAMIATICGQLAIYASAAATPAVGAAAGSACTAMLIAGPKVCNTLGFGSPLYDQTNVAGLLCGPIAGTVSGVESILEALERGAEFDLAQIQAIADFSNVTSGSQTKVLSQIKDISLFDPIPSLSINSLLPTISGFATNPEVPIPGQFYVAQADFRCAFGSQLKMDVYRDGSLISSSSDSGDSTTTRMEASVPANPPGTIDVIRFSGTNSFTGSSVQKSFVVPLQTTISASVSVSAIDDSAAEPDNNGTFRITRVGDTSASLNVNFSLSGTANDQDYQLNGASGETVIIESGKDYADLIINPIDDSESEETESILITLTHGIDYRLISPNSATIQLEDDGQSMACGEYEVLLEGVCISYLRQDILPSQSVIDDIIDESIICPMTRESLGVYVTIPADTSSGNFTACSYHNETLGAGLHIQTPYLNNELNGVQVTFHAETGGSVSYKRVNSANSSFTKVILGRDDREISSFAKIDVVNVTHLSVGYLPDSSWSYYYEEGDLPASDETGFQVFFDSSNMVTELKEFTRTSDESLTKVMRFNNGVMYECTLLSGLTTLGSCL